MAMAAIEPRTGSRVYTADGTELGTVKRVEEVAFFLDVAGGPDFWLKREDIARADATEVRMAFEAIDLEAHQIKYGAV